MTTLLRVLIVEDSEDDTQLELRQLRSGGYELKWERVETPEAMSSALDREEWDVILCDYRMPNFNAPAALTLLQDREMDIPFIIISGTVGEDTAVAAMKSGAHDYLMKDNLAKLVVAVEREIREAKIRQEKRQAVEDLWESERKLRSLFENSPDTIMIIDRQGKLVFINYATTMIDETALGTCIYDYISPEYRQAYVETAEQVFRTGIPYIMQTSGVGPDGRASWYETRFVALESYGEDQTLMLIATDITERRMAVEALQESEEKFRLLADQSLMAIGVIQDGVFKYVNKAYAEMSGYSEQEILSWNPYEYMRIIHPDDRKVVGEQMRRQQTGAQDAVPHYEFRGITKGGDVLYLDMYSRTVIYEGKPADLFTFVNITERKKAEVALRESDEKLRALFNTVGVGITVVDTTGNIVDVNDTVLQMTGYSHKEEVIGKSGFDFIAERDHSRAVQSMMDTLSKESGTAIELTLLRKDGSEFDGESSANVLRDSLGNSTGMVCISRDITERKRMTKALAESEKSYRDLALNIPGMVYRVFLREDNRMEFYNDMLEPMLGFKAEELTNGRICSIEPLIIDEDRPKVIATVKEALRKDTPFDIEYRIRHKNGGLRYFSERGRSIPGPDGKPLIISGIIFDITERKQAEEELQEAARQWQITFDADSDAICLLDSDQRILRCNRAMSEQFGMTQKELIGRHCWEVVHGTTEPIPECPIRRVQSSLNREELEMQLGDLWMHVSADPILDETHTIQGFVHIIHDITNRKRAEEALMASEEKYSMLVEKATDGVTIIQNKLIRFANKRMAEMSGYTVKELIGMSTFDLVPPDFRITLAKRFASRARGAGVSDTFDTQMLCKNGTIKAMESSTRIIQYEGKAATISITRDVTERKLMEEQLHREEQRFRALAEQSSDIIVLVDREGTITYENPAIERVLGLNPEKRIGSSVFARIHPDDLKLVTDEFNTLARNTSAPVQRSEVRIRHRDESWRVFEAVGSNLVNDNVVEAVIINLRDITERKQAEETLLRISKAVESSSDAIGLSDAQGHHFYQNKTFTDLFGYTAQELEAEGGGPVIYANKDIAREVFDAIMSGKSWSGEIEMISKSERKLPIFLRADAIKDDSGKIVGLIGMHTDITERKRAEGALRASEEKFHSIFDSIDDSVTVVDLDGKIIELNEAAVKLFGVKSKEEAIGLSGMAFVADEDMPKTTRQMGEVLSNEKTAPLAQFKYKCLDGTTFYGETSSVILHDAQGNVVGLIAVIRDVTERIQLQEALNNLQQEQIRTKDRFISHVSHEFRSPLASIYQFTTILLDGLAGNISPEQHEYMEIVLRNVQQLRSMVDDLLEMNRAAAGKMTINPRYTAPAELIKEVVETFRRSSTKPMHLSADIPGDLPPVLADAARVREVIINLLDNAMKFTPENGSIDVHAEVYSQDPNFLCIKVSDTGCGINHTEIEKIFDYLHQVENAIDSGRNGIGLGLSICKELISRHGGRIWAESEPGNGSTFFFTLPIFSLSHMLAPIMTEENVATGSIAIVTVEIFPVESRELTRNDESVMQEAWNAVSGCVFPSKDVLLPIMPSSEQGGVFCVVLWADQHGAEALVHRIEEHFDRCQSLRNSGLTPAIFINMLNIPAATAQKPFKEIIKKIAAKVGKQTKVTIIERA